MNQKRMSRHASIRSSRTSLLHSEEDFVTCMTEMCKKFHNPLPVTIIKEYERRDTRTQKNRLMKPTCKRVPLAAASVATSHSGTTDDEEVVTLPITTLYDTQNHLSAIYITKFQEETIPRDTIHLLALVLPNYQQLRKFTIKRCRIDMYVVHEIGKILPSTTITEVCLDDCPLKKANYEELLQNTTFLKNLSLCRCNINDEVCERMAASLHYLESAENSLVTLNLSSNRIGDEGAKNFAEALRSNRHLRYLNLANNHISDEGASHIFNILVDFPLTHDENINRRQRFMVYLKDKLEVHRECLRKLSLIQKPAEKSISNASRIWSQDKIQVMPPKRSSSSHSQVKRKAKRRGSSKSISLNVLISSEDNLLKKAELISGEIVGPFVDPFSPSCVSAEDKPRCFGNFVLCYLNLAYNDLTILSAKKLLKVVEYQKSHYNPDAYGLIKVILEGNPLPVASTELKVLQKMLQQHVKSLQKK
ncbi:hypothetical protein PYW08_004037 [Mythimna loreyi]|uniref:Uncharacterized protein n=1 Tax=Mythimna loreyi TaxID=667449 RepID=A0ACC2QUA7_9NEOP|nr:hypothetical protein PYW08_004037 [Mythimna loreyi]